MKLHIGEYVERQADNGGDLCPAFTEPSPTCAFAPLVQAKTHWHEEHDGNRVTKQREGMAQKDLGVQLFAVGSIERRILCGAFSYVASSTNRQRFKGSLLC